MRYSPGLSFPEEHLACEPQSDTIGCTPFAIDDAELDAILAILGPTGG